MARWLHFAYQNHSKEPGILMGLRTRNEAVPKGEQAFMMASDMLAAEEGYVPVKVSSFGESAESESG